MKEIRLEMCGIVEEVDETITDDAGTVEVIVAEVGAEVVAELLVAATYTVAGFIAKALRSAELGS